MATAYAYGISNVTLDGTILDAWFPVPRLGTPPSPLSDEDAPLDLGESLNNDPNLNTAKGTAQKVVHCTIDTDKAPTDTLDAYLRLQLLSHRLVQPNTINLDGIFGLLPNIVWTNYGPLPLNDDFERTRLNLKLWAPVEVLGVDKFPRMLDYVVPSGVRVADADRVRLGAHLAEGTTVMHEGFVNFNAGTLGKSMVEGRISAGVTVGDGSDVGGGASIMGTLSGGGKEKISIGQEVLLGANSGVGISLGDNCIVEAGLYITAGTRVSLHEGQSDSRVVKASELSGAPNLLYRRNSENGQVEALVRTGQKVELNSELHKN